MEQARPVTEGERVLFWDVLRGVAVLGILLANMQWMSLAAPLANQMERVPGDGPLAAAAMWAVFFLGDSKFITIFSLLFGAGLCFMSERARARGEPFAGLYSRRLLCLLLFGAAHGVLLWFGDILASYAILGFVALLFRNVGARKLVIWAAALLALNLLLFGAMSLGDPEGWVDRRKGPDGVLLSVEETIAAEAGEIREVYASGDFARMLPMRAEHFGFSLVMVLGFWSARTLALFLLGMALVKCGWFLRPADQRARFRRWAVLGLAIGVPLHVVAFIADGYQDQAAGRAVFFATFYLGGLFQAFAYIGIVARWSLSERFTALRARLAAVGRMAFTNYLAQSAITALIFNYAGLFDRIDRATGLGLAVAIFAVQLAWSPWWLNRFHMGPLEWVWRAATYRRRSPFRRVAPAPA